MKHYPNLRASTLQALFETAPDAIIVIDASGAIVLANPQAERLFHYPPQGLRGISVDELVPAESRAVHEAHRARYVAQPRVRPMGTGQELVGLRQDGTQFPVEIALSSIETEDGLFYAASVRDISETQRARQALLRARYDTVIAHIGRLVLESSSQDAAFESIPELLAKELEVEAVAIAFFQPQGDSSALRAATGFTDDLRRVLPALLGADAFPATRRATAPTVGFETLSSDDAARVRKQLDEVGIRDFIAVPLFDRGHSMGALVALARKKHSFDHDQIHFLQSVANLLAATVQRSRSEEQLAHAQRLDAVGQLTGGIAHDFNNLLTVISGNLQLLEAELPDAEQTRDLVSSALRAVGRGADLTRKLLTFARRQRLKPQALNPFQQLNELSPMLARSLGEAISIEVTCEPGVPDVFVDPAELDAAILNLVLNARDAMPRGGTLQIAVDERVIGAGDAGEQITPGHYVAIRVVDAGLGMPPEVLARAFEPFFTTKDTGRGSGLGLSMVYGFVKQSGGHVTADSRLGYGTRIEMLLPATRARRDRAPESRAKPPSARGGEAILVVEDEFEVQRVATAFLNSLGYRTYAAADADAAMQVLNAHPDIALLFSDVVLGSGMNGGELARVACRERPGLAVLLTSGYERGASSVDDSTLKSVPLLRKPYRLEDLATAVRGAIEQRTSR